MTQMRHLTFVSTFLLLFFISTTTGLLDPCFTLGNDNIGGGSSTVTPETKPIAIRFYNGDSINQSYVVSVKNGASIMDQRGFNTSRNTTLFFMGYHQNNVSSGIPATVQVFLEKNETNTVIVDWSDYNTQLYPLALFHAKNTVPKQVKPMIQEMNARGYSIKKFILVGFSLGATVIGYLGREFQDVKFPLITGLDPAGPGAEDCENNLKKGDADFVQIIHGDRGFYAIKKECGDVDVLLNDDGKRFQPGCLHCLTPFTFSQKELCSHTMPWRVYGGSIRDPQSFIGVLCDSYENFVAGKCKNNTKTLAGYGVDTSISGKLYIRTNGNAPYGKGDAGTV